MGSCTSKSKQILENINLWEVPKVAELLIKYYENYDSLTPEDKKKYDEMFLSCIKDLIKK